MDEWREQTHDINIARVLSSVQTERKRNDPSQSTSFLAPKVPISLSFALLQQRGEYKKATRGTHLPKSQTSSPTQSTTLSPNSLP